MTTGPKGPPFSGGLPAELHELGPNPGAVIDVPAQLLTDRALALAFRWAIHALDIRDTRRRAIAIELAKRLDRYGAEEFDHRCRMRVSDDI